MLNINILLNALVHKSVNLVRLHMYYIYYSIYLYSFRQNVASRFNIQQFFLENYRYTSIFVCILAYTTYAYKQLFKT